MSRRPKVHHPPAGYAYGPRYRPSIGTVTRGLARMVIGRPRSLAHAALMVVGDMPVPPLLRGADHLPESGPMVAVCNHYERRGLWMAWPALLMSRMIVDRTGQDTHWIAIQEWQSFRVLGITVPQRLIRAVFARAFGTYGLIPMPVRDAPHASRAGSMRAAARRLSRGAVIGLMPEGDVGPTPELLRVREGVGLFLLLLASMGAPIIPIGVYEEEGRLVAACGSAIDLHAPPGLPKADRDRWASDCVMVAIRNQIPEPLWGAYRNEADATLHSNAAPAEVCD